MAENTSTETAETDLQKFLREIDEKEAGRPKTPAEEQENIVNSGKTAVKFEEGRREVQRGAAVTGATQTLHPETPPIIPRRSR